MFGSGKINEKNASSMDTLNGKNYDNGQRPLNKISEDTVVEGKITSKGDFRVDGTINGDISTLGKIFVGKSGIVNGDIRCVNAEVDGKITGKIAVENVIIIHATGIVEGDLNIGSLITEDGAQLCLTSCKMAKPSDKLAEKDKPFVSKAAAPESPVK